MINICLIFRLNLNVKYVHEKKTYKRVCYLVSWYYVYGLIKKTNSFPELMLGRICPLDGILIEWLPCWERESEESSSTMSEKLDIFQDYIYISFLSSLAGRKTDAWRDQVVAQHHAKSSRRV